MSELLKAAEAVIDALDKVSYRLPGPELAALRVAVDAAKAAGPSDTERRPETGVMQFGDDWPGIFIRGDNAFAYSLALETASKRMPMETGLDKLNIKRCENLAKLFRRCIVTAEYTPDAQRAAMATEGQK